MKKLNIGFVSTRFSGTDGVSLESTKWAQVFEEHGHQCFWYAGRLNREKDVCYEVPEAFFGHADNERINASSFGTLKRPKAVTDLITSQTKALKATLYDFIRHFQIDLLVAENALSIPMHIPLGVALTQLIVESEFPTIAHHHDFYWERDRFSVNAVSDYLQMAFPPALPTIQHVTINSAAQNALAHRKGVPSTIIPNVLDFEYPPDLADTYASDFREQLGIGVDDVIVLQPTRVVPRKGIEQAINLVARLGDPRFKLLVTHESGDEGADYLAALIDMAKASNVDLRFAHARVGEHRETVAHGDKIYSLSDAYLNADLVTYPSQYEGFGNALIEAFYYRKPVVVNRYSIYITDIEPRGFRVIAVDGIMTKRLLDEVRRVVADEDYNREIVDHNYERARAFYSYAVLRSKLQLLVANVTGR